MAKNSMEILISVLDQATGPLKSIMAGVEDLQGAGDRLQEVGGAVAEVGAGMIGLAAPVMGIGAGILQTAGEFEAAMNRVAAAAPASESEMAQLEAAAREMGTTTEFSSAQAAEALENLRLAGMDTQQSIAALPTTLNLAAAGSLELADAAAYSSTILTSFGLQAEDLESVSDSLVATASNYNTSVEDLSAAMGQLGAISQSTNQDFNTLVATVGGIVDAGFSAEETVGNLSDALVAIQTGSASKVFDELRVSVRDANNEMKPLPVLLKELGEAGALADEGIGLLMESFGEGSFPIIQAGIQNLSKEAKEGSKNILDFSNSLEIAEGTTDRAANTMRKGLAYEMAELSSAMEGLDLAIADTGILDFAASMVGAVTGIVVALSNAHPGILGFITLIAGVGATLLVVGGTILVVAGGIAAAIGSLITTFSAGGPLAFMTPMLTGAATALASFATGLATVVGLAAGLMAIPFAIFQIGAAAQGTTFSVQEFFNVIRTSIAEAPALLAQIPAAFRGAFMAAVNIAQLSFAQIVEAIKSKAAEMVEAIRSAGSRMVAAITGLVGDFRAAGANIISSLVQGIQSKIGEAQEAIASVASKIRGALPFSPPKWGPLSDIMSAGGNIVQSIASGISPAPIASAMSRALTPTQGQLASPTGGGGGGSVSVNFAPVINAGAGTDVGAIRQMLEEQIEQMIRQIQRNQERVRYG